MLTVRCPRRCGHWQIIAANLPTDEINGMRELFMEIDVDKSGSISAEEFANALRKKGNSLPEDEVQRLVKDADIDGDGTIDYEVRGVHGGEEEERKERGGAYVERVHARRCRQP